MFKKSSQRSMFVVGSLLGLSSFISLLSPVAPNANAASIYDNALVLTSSLKYNDANENVIDVSKTWRSHMLSACGSTVYNDFLQSLDGGAWAVSQDSTSDDYGITVEWSKPDNTIPHASFYSYGTDKWLGIDPGYYGKVRYYFNSTTDADTCDYSSLPTYHATNFAGVLTQESWSPPLGLYLSTYTVNYPPDYAGTYDPSSVDIDGDNLTRAQELSQGTSDTSKDTDGDGLDDFTESHWYPNRSGVFCGSSECTYPDPVKKDLYVEVDWMKEPGLSGGVLSQIRRNWVMRQTLMRLRV
jgi:hypothetical protein